MFESLIIWRSNISQSSSDHLGSYKQPTESCYCFYWVILSIVTMWCSIAKMKVELSLLVNYCHSTDVITVHVWRNSTRLWRQQPWKQWTGASSTGDHSFSTDVRCFQATEGCFRTKNELDIATSTVLMMILVTWHTKRRRYFTYRPTFRCPARTVLLDWWKSSHVVCNIGSYQLSHSYQN